MAGVIVIGGANVDIKGRALGSFVPGSSNPGEVRAAAGGVARNIAENLARLGIAADLLSFVGNDANGRVVIEACRAAGVGIAMIEHCDEPTGVYLAVLDERGEMVGAINDMRNMEAFSVGVLERHSDRMAAAGLLVADCNLPAECLDWLCRFSARSGISLVLEPVSVAKAQKLTTFRRSQPVFAITPNRMQLSALTGCDDSGEAIRVLHDMGFANVIVHCGKEGAVVSAAGGGSPRAVTAYPVAKVSDVTGAGDAAVAGFVSGVMLGLDVADAVRLGQAAAAVKLGSRNSVATEISRDRVLSLAGVVLGT